MAGLIEAIDRRQQGMDAQQEEIRERIGLMLEATWFEAIRSCEELLESTSGALQELHRALMYEIEGMSSLLNEIEEVCEIAGQDESVEALAHVRRQMERISAWGESRFTGWSEYYQNVHEVIRSVVTVDPDRAIRTRLRDGLKGYGKPVAWFLTVADQPSYKHVRDQSHEESAQKVERKRSLTGMTLEEAGLVESHLEPLEKELSFELQQRGRLDLVELLLRHFPNHAIHEIYVLAGDDHRLRTGVHIDMDDIRSYEFLLHAEPFLQVFYEGYACRLVQGQEDTTIFFRKVIFSAVDV